ncbi:DUF3499 domain-containing protein [Sinomonas halotolerans]
MATLTYVYADSTAVLGPLATFAEPHSYDLCAMHAERLTVPRGWEVLRLAVPAQPPASADDLLAIAEALRDPEPKPEQAEQAPERTARPPLEAPPGTELLSRRHLRLLREPF